jgi:outer membrane usher protein
VRSLTSRRRCGVLVAGLLLCSSTAWAQNQRAVLELVVNQVSAGESIVVLRGSDVLVPADALVKAGLEGLKGERVEIGGASVVSLSSLAPNISFRLDESELRLYITANPDLLGPQVHNLFTGAPADLVYKADASGFVNYAVNYSTAGRLELFAESAVSLKGGLVYNTVSTIGSSATRGITSVSFDQKARMRRWTFGDSLGYTGPLGGDAWIAGISVSKEFSINPYYVRHPTLSLTTPISVPSVMEVQVNGQVVSREQVAPGRLEVRNLPMTLGRNDAQIIVRDAFGGERELSSDYYLTTTALAKGVHEYQYSLGFRRVAVGEKSWDYRTPVALARHRVGVSDTLTVGGRFETHPGRLFSTGPSFNIRLPLGEVETAAAVSRRRGEWGSAALVGFSRIGRVFSAGGNVTVSSRQYATLAPAITGQEPAIQANAFASTSVGGQVTVTAQHTMTKLHQGLTRSRTGLLSTIRLTRTMDLTASVSRVSDGRVSGREAYAGVAIAIGRATASAAYVSDVRGGRLSLDAQRPLPVAEGYGYQLHAENGQLDMVSGVARYQSRYGRYEVRQEMVAGQAHTAVSAAGSIVGIGGGLHASRPVQDSFALIRVPGVEGVRAYASHQEIGKTGRRGDLLIPDLQAYYGNVLGVADGDIPIQYSVPDTGQTLALPYRGGAVAVFPVQRIQRVVGVVKIVDGSADRSPAYGEVVVTARGKDLTSPIGSTGAFYFEDLPEGTHSAVVHERDGRTCAFTVKVPASDSTVVNLGTLRCEPRP